MNLQPFDREVGCFRLYTIVHEFLHAIGFYHMQSATERDDYVKIIWEKIQAGTESNFDAYGSDIVTNYNVEYDYGSVMHYGPTAFSIDGNATIVPLRDLKGETMGQRLRLSKTDISSQSNVLRRSL
jgi:Astacin (Peptidase family M12A)